MMFVVSRSLEAVVNNLSSGVFPLRVVVVAEFVVFFGFSIFADLVIVPWHHTAWQFHLNKSLHYLQCIGRRYEHFHNFVCSSVSGLGVGFWCFPCGGWINPFAGYFCGDRANPALCARLKPDRLILVVQCFKKSSGKVPELFVLRLNYY